MDKKYVIYGAGSNGRGAYEYLRKCIKVTACADKNSDLWGMKFGGGVRNYIARLYSKRRRSHNWNRQTELGRDQTRTGTNVIAHYDI